MAEGIDRPYCNMLGQETGGGQIYCQEKKGKKDITKAFLGAVNDGWMNGYQTRMERFHVGVVLEQGYRELAVLDSMPCQDMKVKVKVAKQ